MRMPSTLSYDERAGRLQEFFRRLGFAQAGDPAVGRPKEMKGTVKAPGSWIERGDPLVGFDLVQ
jgi:hypothetical protein